MDEALMDEGLPLLDRALAEPHHLLVLPGDVAPEEVEALAMAHFDDAGWIGPTVLRVSGEAQLTGPWRLDAELREVLDLPPRAETAMQLRCPVQRSAPVPPELRGLGGLRDAFPDGEPVDLEGRVLAHLLAQARRLAGALRVAGSGSVLVPDPASAVDLTVHSPVWLDRQACAQVLEPVLPGFAPAQAPDDAPRRTGYAHAVGVEDGSIEVSVSGAEHIPDVLRAVPWARGEFISYDIRWHPNDPQVALGTRPPLGLRRVRRRVRARIGSAALAVHAAVGGEVVDDDGFRVAVGSLTGR